MVESNPENIRETTTNNNNKHVVTGDQLLLTTVAKIMTFKTFSPVCGKSITVSMLLLTIPKADITEPDPILQICSMLLMPQ